MAVAIAALLGNVKEMAKGTVCSGRLGADKGWPGVVCIVGLPETLRDL